METYSPGTGPKRNPLNFEGTVNIETESLERLNEYRRFLLAKMESATSQSDSSEKQEFEELLATVEAQIAELESAETPE